MSHKMLGVVAALKKLIVILESSSSVCLCFILIEEKLLYISFTLFINILPRYFEENVYQNGISLNLYIDNIRLFCNSAYIIQSS